MHRNKDMRFNITISIGSSWPNGDPISSELLPDGRTRYTMEDGRIVTVGAPNYKLEYQSRFVGAGPEDTYEVRIAIGGLSARKGYFEAWNFDSGKMRNYAFERTARITHLESGEVFTGEELKDALDRGQTEQAP